MSDVDPVGGDLDFEDDACKLAFLVDVEELVELLLDSGKLDRNIIKVQRFNLVLGGFLLVGHRLVAGVD